MVSSPSGPLSTRGPVRIVGAGLIGTSIGLGLATRGVDVQLADASPTALALAVQVGAGKAAHPSDPAPAIVVVAAPPDVCGTLVAQALATYRGAIVTDVASVKAPVLADVVAAGGDLTRYVGSHPMAGRELSGAIGAQADLLVGRPWVIVPAPGASDEAILTIRALAVDLGASPVTMPAADHDRAVAIVSHLPQLLASALAAQLTGVDEQALALAGQGLRDTTRIAGSSPQLWSQIIAANLPEVLPLLRSVSTDIGELIGALERSAAPGRLTTDAPNDDEAAPAIPVARLGPALEGVARLIEHGNSGVRRIPGKHGGARRDWDQITVLVPDEPGQLARLFTEVGAIGVNLEDFSMEHSPGQPVGLVALSVAAGVGDMLADELTSRAWTVVA